VNASYGQKAEASAGTYGSEGPRVQVLIMNVMLLGKYQGQLMSALPIS
jgi:hypothetical protein